MIESVSSLKKTNKGQVELPLEVRAFVKEEINKFCSTYSVKGHMGSSQYFTEDGCVNIMNKFNFISKTQDSFNSELFKFKVSEHNKDNPDNKINLLLSSSLGVCRIDSMIENDQKSASEFNKRFAEELKNVSRDIISENKDIGFEDFKKIAIDRFDELIEGLDDVDKYLIIKVENFKKEYTLIFETITITDSGISHITINEKESFYIEEDNINGFLSV